MVVKYIRNPFFDDHFDIRIPEHIVGKTLAWCSSDVSHESIRNGAQVLGWSLYEKWDKLKISLGKVKTMDSKIVSKQI